MNWERPIWCPFCRGTELKIGETMKEQTLWVCLRCRKTFNLERQADAEMWITSAPEFWDPPSTWVIH